METLARAPTGAEATERREGVVSNQKIEALVDAAMSVLAFDWMWDDESIPEVKYARDQLREKFSEVLERKQQKGLFLLKPEQIDRLNGKQQKGGAS